MALADERLMRGCQTVAARNLPSRSEPLVLSLVVNTSATLVRGSTADLRALRLRTSPLLVVVAVPCVLVLIQGELPGCLRSA
eukprot:9043654-Pyramimonas_sp.AAC.1